MVALVNRKVIDTLLVDRRSYGSARGLHDVWRCGRHGYPGRDFADFQTNILIRGLTDSEFDGRDDCSLIAGRRNRYFIFTWRQIDDLVKAIVVRRRLSRKVCRHTTRGHRSIGHDRTVGIAYYSLQVCRVGLRLRHRQAET